ncbi:MAG TPA: tubulin-like doman-containing protein [Noviherbaspirillum sp.]|nr:tubulin-like doman-containing protein [Noviherbaspirillum sp.]
MSEGSFGPSKNVEASTQAPKKLIPVLFIGLGGTGMEVILRIRRRILHATWGKSGDVRVGSLEEFPVAEFMHFDLDQGAVLEEGRSSNTDPLAALVKLPAQDRVVSGLDLLKYARSEDDLHKYPNIASWFPLTSEKIRALQIDPAKGAGQIRSLSRLYFFDNYRQTRDTIAQKLDHLKANRSNQAQLNRLGLEVDNEKIRVVVIGSVAGGTGSGSFLDMGWLAKRLAAKAFGGSGYDVQLILFTPRGYAKANKERTEANGYAALMELETCMRQFPEFVGTWSPDEGRPDVDPTPYTDVYVVESANMGRHALEDVKDMYEMVADVLFEDFASEEFANRKRSVAVNQQQHKGLPYHPPLSDMYGEMKLKYNMGYSSFGQSILDTQLSQRLDEQEYRWAAAMLEAFFGVSGTDRSALQATDQQRDDFLRQHLKLNSGTFDRFPDFGSRKDLQGICAPFVDNQLTDDLLVDEHGGIEDSIQQKVNALVEEIKADRSNIKDWPRLLRERIPAMEQDVIRNQDTTASTSEDRVARRQAQVLLEKQNTVRAKLYDYLDNREYGGLEFVLSLAELVKTSFDHPATGLVQALEANAQRYQKVRDALKTNQVEETLNNIGAAVKSSLFSGPDAKKATTYLDDLKKDLGDYLRFHVRSVSATNGARLLRKLSEYIGGRNGTDAKGSALYTGILEEFHAGRREVLAVGEEIRRTTATIADSGAKSHANYLYLPADIATPQLPDQKALREWADEAFKDFEGSRKIFPMLKTAEGKAKLLAKLRAKAVTARARRSASAQDQDDPLLKKLLGLEPQARQRVFSDFLRAAMPWIDANFADVPLKADRFKCFLGVMEPKDWAPLVDEIRASIPTYAGITADQLQLCKTGNPGRAVAFCELSGFPLRVLRGLENWRTSYRQVSKDWPLHTHIDPTLFVQPMVPTSDELKLRAEDFRLYLLAVALRKLVRNPRATIPPGQYQFDFGRGDRRDFGNERRFRIHGFDAEYRTHVERAVNEALEELDAVQLKALSGLAVFLQRETYAPALSRDDTGVQRPVPGFAHAIAARLSQDLLQMARQRGLSDEEEVRVDSRLCDWGEGWSDVIKSFDLWTEAIPESAKDGYAWEIKDPEPDASDRSKRRVKKEFFEPGWLAGLIAAPAASTTAVASHPSAPLMNTVAPAFINPLVPSAGHQPPPPPMAAPVVAYLLHISGQNHGPYPVVQLQQWVAAGQVAPSTLAWREGMPGWQALNTLPEFMGAPMGGLIIPPPPATGI